MPTNRSQKFVFALLSVIISVNCFVFYNLAIEFGGMSNAVFAAAYSTHTWVLPIPLVVVEFVFAILLELFVGGPLSEKIAFSVLGDLRDTKPYVIVVMLICCTVVIMCPAMSLIATILYQVIPVGGFSSEFFAQWMQTMTHNFPFAFFAELFFIQPAVRFLFRLIYRKQLAAAKAQYGQENGADAAENVSEESCVMVSENKTQVEEQVGATISDLKAVKEETAVIEVKVSD